MGFRKDDLVPRESLLEHNQKWTRPAFNNVAKIYVNTDMLNKNNKSYVKSY